MLARSKTVDNCKLVFKGCMKTFLLGAVLYVTSFIMIFDITRTGYSADEETYQGKAVAEGPTPRSIFCSYYGDSGGFSGAEWPFEVYAPLCLVWLHVVGYAPASHWRYWLKPNAPAKR
jgi:hypothetical protein